MRKLINNWKKLMMIQNKKQKIKSISTNKRIMTMFRSMKEVLNKNKRIKMILEQKLKNLKLKKII
jgi:hypothetical protein